MSHYFITGATGAIGSSLVPVLLQQPTSELTLLLRAETADKLTERLEDLYRFWGIGSSDQAARQRIRALRGDVTLPEFGLTAHEYQALCAACTHIIHAAGNVRMNLPIEQARRSSVDSAKHVVALAHAAPKLEKIEFVSTVGVGGRTYRQVPEEWLTERRDFHNTYEQAKAEAEELVRGEAERGLPVTVHRPSMVVGESASGRIIHFQVFYHLCEFLSGQRTRGLSPRFGGTRLDVVPADYVAKTIAWSSQTSASGGLILHSCSGPTLAVALVPLRERVRAAFSRAGRDLPRMVELPTPLFKAIVAGVSVFMPTELRRAVRTLPVFLDYLATEQTFINQRTQELLAAAQLPVPHPDRYLDKVLDYYLERSR